mgnify:CR=1 FL=1
MSHDHSDDDDDSSVLSDEYNAEDVVDTLNYELALTEVIDDFGIEKTLFCRIRTKRLND